MGRRVLAGKKVCYACGSSETKIERKSGWECWFRNHGTDLFLCNNCYNTIILSESYKKYEAQESRRTRYDYKALKYKGTIIYFKTDIRCGVCNWCRAVEVIDTNYTSRHHDENLYNDTVPLWNTLEICQECHSKETQRLEKIRIGYYDRICYGCGGSNPHGEWWHNKPTELFLCRKCYRTFVTQEGRWNKKW